MSYFIYELRYHHPDGSVMIDPDFYTLTTTPLGAYIDAVRKTALKECGLIARADLPPLSLEEARAYLQTQVQAIELVLLDEITGEQEKAYFQHRTLTDSLLQHLRQAESKYGERAEYQAYHALTKERDVLLKQRLRRGAVQHGAKIDQALAENKAQLDPAFEAFLKVVKKRRK